MPPLISPRDVNPFGWMGWICIRFEGYWRGGPWLPTPPNVKYNKQTNKLQRKRERNPSLIYPNPSPLST